MILLQQVLLSYASRTVCTDVPFWRMVATPLAELRTRAKSIVATAGVGSVVDVDSLVGAGSAPGSTIASIGIALGGDHRAALRSHTTPVITRTVGNTTFIDMRSIAPADDHVVVAALSRLR
jgi:L-seryl-tRNA(Ser) seleniumtransferase